VDRANNSYNRELMFSLSDGERQLVLQIDAALRRMDEGLTGAAPTAARRSPSSGSGVPWARFCIDCQEMGRKGLLEAEAS